MSNFGFKVSVIEVCQGVSMCLYKLRQDERRGVTNEHTRGTS
jgi:hypothetical protein